MPYKLGNGEFIYKPDEPLLRWSEEYHFKKAASRFEMDVPKAQNRAYIVISHAGGLAILCQAYQNDDLIAEKHVYIPRSEIKS